MNSKLIIATLFLAGIAASAQDVPADRDSARVIRRVEHRLGVTDSQREQLKTILAQERPALSELHAKLAGEHAELAALSTFDEGQTRAILAKYAEANVAAALEREKLRVEVFAIMTPQQKKKLDELRTRFSGAMEDHLQTLGDKL